MSEAMEGMPPPPPPATPREAAAVVLFRRVEGEVQLFWLKREKKLTFAGGFYAFAGGRVDPSDATIEVEHALPESARLIAAAARELLEETGVLVARGAERLSGEAVALMRRALLDKKQSFKALLEAQGLRLHAFDFHSAGRWITPPFLPARFDAHFFLVQLPEHAEAEVWPGELTEGAWIAPAEALRRWEEGSALLHPPNLHALQVLGSFGRLEEALEKLWNPEFCPGFIPNLIEFQQGIRIFPLVTPTLPPASHTNCYVLGNEELVLVDPGSADVRQQARLLALLAGLQGKGKFPVAIVLTHHHQDHSGGAQALAERLRIPVWCHPTTADRLSFPVARRLNEGDVITLAGEPKMEWQVLHTPGHARGHICLVDARSRAAVVGDMVAGMGTIVIDPPEGNMTDYLAQLARLREWPVGTLYPAHGPVIPDGPGKLTEYIEHREAREQKVLANIPARGCTRDELVPKAYDDVPPYVLPLAERSTQAILDKLLQEGRLRQEEGRYVPAGESTPG